MKTESEPTPVSPAATITWLALMYVGLVVLGVFSHPTVLGAAVTTGLLVCPLLMIFKRTWSQALGAVIGRVGQCIVDAVAEMFTFR